MGRLLLLVTLAAGTAAADRDTPQRARRKVDRALQNAFGKGTQELEPLWRRFTLEIDWTGGRE